MISIETLQSKQLKPEDAFCLNSLQRELRSGGVFKDLYVFGWQLIASQGNARVVVLKEEGKIIGMAILRWHDLPGGRVATLEDVVVNAKYRGMGYGEALVKKIIELANENNIDFIDLTSNASREAANELYRKLGWEKRETNVYRLYLKSSNF